MVLSSGYGQHWLHRWSRQAVQDQKRRGSAWASPERTINTHIPVYGTAATSKENPKIPDPSLFNSASEDSEIDNARLPTFTECAIHLELLEVFYNIRLKVLSSTTLDAVLGIKPEPRTVYRKKCLGYRCGYSRQEVKLRDNTFEERRKTKWPFYLALAAIRFLYWAEAVEKERDKPTASIHLPPIDVLMVWHALLLNPRWFRSFEALPLKNLCTTPFPWNEIHKAIDADRSNWPYSLPGESITWFLENTGLEPDLFGVLVKTTKSTKIQQLLKRKGAPGRYNNKHRDIAVEDVDAVLRCPADLDELDITFLMCCREAVNKNTTVTKLVDAVQRQASFVDKMEMQLWIRSPAVEGTLRRAIDRYSKFLNLFKLYPKTMLVPTLDIDLVWHTHQCSPSQYEVGTVKMAGRLIDHDDKLGKETLGTGFTRTGDLYRIRFAQDYQVCNCWDCEALVSVISARSSENQTDNGVIARNVHEKVAYHRAVEIARRKGYTRLPIRIRQAEEEASITY